MNNIENKYYTPDISEFHVGFEYEIKNTFGDGTVKTLEQYNEAKWIKQVYTLRTFPYVDRIMTGKNSQNLPPAIRVKYLDKEDIESLQFIFEEQIVGSITFKHRLYNFIELHLKGSTVIILNNGRTIFEGIIKNKSELQKVMKMLGIKTVE